MKCTLWLPLVTVSGDSGFRKVQHYLNAISLKIEVSKHALTRSRNGPPENSTDLERAPRARSIADVFSEPPLAKAVKMGFSHSHWPLYHFAFPLGIRSTRLRSGPGHTEPSPPAHLVMPKWADRLSRLHTQHTASKCSRRGALTSLLGTHARCCSGWAADGISALACRTFMQSGHVGTIAPVGAVGTSTHLCGATVAYSERYMCYVSDWARPRSSLECNESGRSCVA